jgi:predicted RNase H-like nuclease (RuvC/YqgF family)
MAIFGKTKNYESIVAPLKKMVDNLKSYVDEQKTKIAQLKQDREDIDKDIKLSEGEIAKSEFTTGKIRELINPNTDKADG